MGLKPTLDGDTVGDARDISGVVWERYFPTFICHRDLAGSEVLNASIKPHIRAWQSDDREGIHRSNVKQIGSWHSRLDMHQREEYRELAIQILAAAQEIFDTLGYDPAFEPVFDNMWANVHPRYGFNRHHTHPNTLWSGVYYVQVPPDAGRILFCDPRPQAQSLTPRYVRDQKRKREVWSEVRFQPIEGRAILFPSWLPHEVEPNLSRLEGQAGDRISVSFNLIQKRHKSKKPAYPSENTS